MINIIITNSVMFSSLNFIYTYIIQVIIAIIAIGYIMYCTIYWIYCIKCSYKATLFPSVHDLKKRDLVCLVYMISFIIYFYSTWLSVFEYNVSGKWAANIGVNFLTLYMSVVTLSFVSIYFISSHVAKLQLIETKVIL